MRYPVNKEQLQSMKTGDTLKGGILFPGLSAEELEWELVEIRNAPQKSWTFVVKYFGVLICDFVMDEGMLDQHKEVV